MSTHIGFDEGYKDDHRVYVRWDNPKRRWHPTNKAIFVLIDKWFEAEESWFSSGYGKTLPWFYLSLIAIGEGEVAREAYRLRGQEAKHHFFESVEQYADEIIALLRKLKEDTK